MAINKVHSGVVNGNEGIHLMYACLSVLPSFCYIYTAAAFPLHNRSKTHYLKGSLISLNLSFFNLHSQQSSVLKGDSVLENILMNTDFGTGALNKTSAAK